MAMATLHTRADGTALEWRGASSLLPSVPPSAQQATDRGRGHSRAAFQSPSLRNVIHSPSADLLSDLQLGGAAARRLGGGSEPHSSGRGATEQRSYAQNSLAPITRLPGPVAGGRPAPGLAEISTLYTQKTTGFPGSLARSVSPVFPFLQSRIDSMKSGSDPFARVRPPRHPSRSDSSSVPPISDGKRRKQIGATEDRRGREEGTITDSRVAAVISRGGGGGGEQVGLIMPIHSFPASIQPGIAIALSSPLSVRLSTSSFSHCSH